MSTVLIGHASISEKGTVNGTKGDSTGKEVCTRTWYSKPWDFMAIHPDANVREKHAKAVEDAGADGVSLINTLLGMKIDIDKRRPVLANNTGGLSGPAIKPVAVRMVYQVANAVNIPIIGMGGVSNYEDVIEFMMAGATAVAIGAMNFHNPYATEEAIHGIEHFMKKQGIDDINNIICL